MMPPTSPRTPPHFPVPDIGSNVRTDAARALVSFVTMMALVVMAGLFTLATASAQNYVTNVNYEYFVPVTNGGSAPIWSISAGTVYTVQLTNGPTNPVGPTTTIYNNTTNASLNWISTAENSDTKKRMFVPMVWSMPPRMLQRLSSREAPLSPSSSTRLMESTSLFHPSVPPMVVRYNFKIRG